MDQDCLDFSGLQRLETTGRKIKFLKIEYLDFNRHSNDSIGVKIFLSESNKNRLLIRQELLVKDQIPSFYDNFFLPPSVDMVMNQGYLDISGAQKWRQQEGNLII